MPERLKTDLSTFNNDWYKPGSVVKRGLWFMLNAIFFRGYIFPFSGIKVALLRLFGAKMGKGVVIKPDVNIKYPWKLVLGNNVWIGEGVWIDNLDEIRMESNVCVSQGALLLCGNHDFSKPGFDLMTGPIVLEEGAWVGARSVVTANVRLGSHSVLAVSSVANSDLKAYGIYQGNPAVFKKERVIS